MLSSMHQWTAKFGIGWAAAGLCSALWGSALWGSALWGGVLTAGALSGCKSEPPAATDSTSPAEGGAAEAAKSAPTVAPVEEPPASASAVAAIMGGDSAAAATENSRFRKDYLKTEEITKDPVLIKAIETLADDDRGQAVFDELKPRKEEVLPVLRKALWHETPNVRIHVAKMLYLFEDRTEATADALIDVLLHDADQDVRAVIARVLVSHKTRRAVPALALAVETDPFVHVRANAVRALGSIGDTSAASAVKKGLNDRETWVRLRALGAVEELRLRDALPIVKRLANDPNSEVRKKAQKVLSVLGG